MGDTDIKTTTAAFYDLPLAHVISIQERAQPVCNKMQQ